EIALAVAPGKGAAGAGMAEGLHARPHRHRVGLVVHEAVAHADAPLGHDAVVFPHELRSALRGAGRYRRHAADRAFAGDHRVDARLRPRAAMPTERRDLELADF